MKPAQRGPKGPKDRRICTNAFPPRGFPGGTEKGLIEMADINSTAAKRTVATAPAEKQGLSTQDLILIAVLLAAGAVLKMTVASFFQAFGMKPNFIIAMYCLAIILTKPTVKQSMVIGIRPATETGIGATLNDKGKMTNDKGIFNLNGQRIAQPTKGLYIVNGKKIVIK